LIRFEDLNRAEPKSLRLLVAISFFESGLDGLLRAPLRDLRG
jgi:hypothetical protein